jgi:hypothetical protein
LPKTNKASRFYCWWIELRHEILTSKSFIPLAGQFRRRPAKP